MSGKKKESHPGLLGENRKARFNYIIEETLECGIELRGTEVKSMKSAQFSFVDSFCEIKKRELFIRNLHITPYAFANLFNHNPERIRRLLAHKQEIKKLERKVTEKGYTLIPLKFYLVNGRVKVEIGLCKGKKTHDKREAIKERTVKRDMQREARLR